MTSTRTHISETVTGKTMFSFLCIVSTATDSVVIMTRWACVKLLTCLWLHLYSVHASTLHPINQLLLTMTLIKLENVTICYFNFVILTNQNVSLGFREILCDRLTGAQKAKTFILSRLFSRHISQAITYSDWLFFCQYLCINQYLNHPTPDSVSTITVCGRSSTNPKCVSYENQENEQRLNVFITYRTWDSCTDRTHIHPHRHIVRM